MLTSGMKESQSNTIHIQEMRHPVFITLLTYFYTGKADIDEENVIELLMTGILPSLHH